MRLVSIAIALFACLAMSCEGAEGPAGVDGADGIDGTDGTNGTNGTDVAAGYAGSASCESCHEENYAGWVNSAHPYKVVSKDDVVAGTAYPAWVSALQGELFAVDDDFFTDQAALLTIDADTFPNGGWDDVTYVIGGYGWKARFMGLDGYIITGNDNGTPNDTADDDKIQYNLPYEPDLFGPNAYADVDASSATYHTGELKPYTCGTCHTTGWIPDLDAETDNDLTDNQDGLAGIWGTWVETGVGCEACHGPSAGHAARPDEVATSWEPTSSCANCHIRGFEFEIDVKGGFIRHHEQFEELVQSKHAAIGCEGCHAAHDPVKWQDEWLAIDDTGNDPNPDYVNRSGVRMECENCHFQEAAAYTDWATGSLSAMAGVECKQCHMPSAAKSAVKAGDYHGDISSHLMGINSLIDPGVNPELTTTGANPANPYITLDWACGGCHSDTVAGTDVANPDFYVWAINAIEANGGVHGGN
jgi:hypothetical protein